MILCMAVKGKRNGGPPPDAPVLIEEDLRPHGVRACPKIGYLALSGGVKPVAAHRHDDKLEICYLFSGERVYRRENETFFMRGGDVWLNAPGTLHGACVQPSGASRFYWCLLSPPEYFTIFSRETAEGIWDAFLRHNAGTFRAEPTLRHYFDQILRLAALPPGPAVDDRLRVTFSMMLLSVTDSLRNPGSLCPHPKIRALLKELDESREYSRETTADLARRAKMSESHFKMEFRKTVGVPPIRYLKHLWLMRAARELTETDAPITGIAMKYGFSSSQHFSTVFRRYFSVTPLAYRKCKGRIAPDD